jgi:hypothetical protein
MHPHQLGCFLRIAFSHSLKYGTVLFDGHNQMRPRLKLGETPRYSDAIMDLRLGNLGDECAVMRTNLDKPFRFQSPHSLSNWRATDLQLFRYAVLIKLLTRLKVAMENRFSKAGTQPMLSINSP